MHFGDTIFANHRTAIFNDRPTKPVLILGEPSKEMLFRLALEDIRAGKGLAFFGETNKLLRHIPRSRINDTIFFELDPERPRIFNPFAHGSWVADYVSEALGADENTPQLATYLTLLTHVMIAVKGTLYTARHLFT